MNVIEGWLIMGILWLGISFYYMIRDWWNKEAEGGRTLGETQT